MFRIEIETDNDAFQEKEAEVARILEELAKRIAAITDANREAGSVFDSNGNRVGHYAFTS